MLHDLIVVLTQDQVCLVVRELISSHTVEGDAEFVGHESTEVGDESEDTDTTSDSGRLCEDVVGRRTDPVAARGCHTSHRHDHGLLGLQQFDGMTDLLRGHGTTTTGVHTEHHSLHVIVVSQFAQVCCSGLAHDAVSAAVH